MIPHMERISITIPGDLLDRIDKGGIDAKMRRSAYIVHILEEYYRERDDKGRIKADLLSILHSDEGMDILHTIVAEILDDEWKDRTHYRRPSKIGLPPESTSREKMSPLAPAPRRRKSAGSIPITDDMKTLMRSFMANANRPTNKDILAMHGADLSNISRCISGERMGMRVSSWEKIRPVLERYRA